MQKPLPLRLVPALLVAAGLAPAARLAAPAPEPRSREFQSPEPAPAPPADEALRAIELRLEAVDERLAELDLAIADNRDERRGLRPAHTRARRLDAEYGALLARQEALLSERGALRAELLVRRKLAEEEAAATASAGEDAEREARLEALLLGADALGQQGLVEQASVLLEMYREVEGAETAAAAESEGPAAGVEASEPDVSSRLAALESRVLELTATVGELVALLKAERER